MIQKRLLPTENSLARKEKRPQEGGVGPQILSTAGLLGVTIDTSIVQVKHFCRPKP